MFTNPFSPICNTGAKSGSLKPQIPEGCPDDYAALIKDCIQTHPSRRPTFDEITTRLKTMARPTKLPENHTFFASSDSQFPIRN
jgi:hypothetical protein